METGIIIANTEIPVFANKQLNSATKRIFALGNKAAKAMYEVAAILAKVQSNGTFKDDGFKNAAEYACKTFGFKKSLAYSLIKIGREYTAENSLESNLPHPDNEDFTTNQIGLMLPIGDRDKVVEMCEAEELKPSMTAKEIREAVKRVTGKETEEAESSDTEEFGSSESEKVDNPREKVVHYLNMAKSALYDCGFTAEDNSALVSAILSIISDIENK